MGLKIRLDRGVKRFSHIVSSSCMPTYFNSGDL